MIITQQDIKSVVQGVIDEFLIPKFISLGMNASGNWIESLEARATETTGEIWGADYTYYLVNGRAGGNRPPIAPLIRWVGYKMGLSGNEAIGAAFAIANKIAKEGTSYYPEGTDLLEVLHSDEVANYIYDRLGRIMNAHLSIQITNDLKRILA